MGDFLSKLFNLSSPGQKIKQYIKISYIIEVILTSIAAFILVIYFAIDYDSFAFVLLAPIAAIVSFFLAWIILWPTTIFLYGFGELIENSGEIIIEQRQTQVLNTISNKEYEKNSKKQKYTTELESREIHQEVNVQKNAVLHENEKRRSEYMMPKTTSLLAEKLIYALKYSTDEGMISYLKSIENEKIAEILKHPSSEIRQAVKDLLNSEQ